VYCQRDRQGQKALGNEENLSGERGVDDEEAVSHARKHLRPRQRPVDRVADDLDGHQLPAATP